MNETKSINIVDYEDVSVFVRILLENFYRNIHIEEAVVKPSQTIAYKTYVISWEEFK